MERIAHRGFAAEAPENTAGAVRRARSQADCVEVDVRRSADGRLVVVHDETVDRVTAGTGRVADTSAADLAGLTVEGSDEGIPTLRTVLDAAGETPVNVELKEHGLAEDALAVVAAHDVPVLFSSFDPAVLSDLRERDPDVPTAYLTGSVRDRPVETALACGCTHLHPHYHLALATTLVPRAHTADLTVNAWTVNRPFVAGLCRRVGVDGVITDRSDVG